MIDKYIGKKVLINCDHWFVGPDGKDHMAVWGTLKGVHEAGKHLGFIPNRAHANWFYEIGSMIIMGCQVKYLCLCETKPDTDTVAWSMREGLTEPLLYKAPNKILILD
jgi:hypothetical protein